ncbi:hypothetical protein DPQ33_13825 [Oceanidesulfovibrio indonesiensis]|uniref:Uncharacterized protein n=1 Tax=Oceanidesulfovibrio indonesiensis TaxID=54767 RepID=A0A7M3MCI5_9BACT|nr:hypothetical protein DPQ33_13825 [Oceanidesulfovibrio indonesiensis]
MHALEKREVEHALRAAGFSRSQAVVAVSVVNRVLKENTVPARILDSEVQNPEGKQEAQRCG